METLKAAIYVLPSNKLLPPSIGEMSNIIQNDGLSLFNEQAVYIEESSNRQLPVLHQLTNEINGQDVKVIYVFRAKKLTKSHYDTFLGLYNRGISILQYPLPE